MAKTKKSNLSNHEDAVGKDVDRVIQNLTKVFGKGVAYQGGSEVRLYEKGVISTGILSLDRALGIGGFPIGRIIEIFGAEMSGKSSLALKVAGEAQRKGIPIFFIDLEHALDMELARNSGVDVDSKNWCVSQPDYGEQAMQIIEIVLNSGIPSFIVVDSVAALLPKVELDTAFTDKTQLGRQAALMSEALRKLAGIISKSNSTVVFVNQTRQKIGAFVVPGSSSTPGGNALKYYSSIRINIRSIGRITKTEEVIGHKARIKIEKNKLSAPFKEVEVELFYGSGFCGIADVLNRAEANGIVDKSGAWYSYEGERLGNGLYNTLKFLVEWRDVYFSIRDKVLALTGTTLAYDEMYYDKTIKFGDVTVIGGEGESTAASDIDLMGDSESEQTKSEVQELT